MLHAGVGDVAAERDVQFLQLDGRGDVRVGKVVGSSQETDPDVADVVARAEVKILKPRRSGQRLETGVGDADAETQIQLFKFGKTCANVFERFVRKLLAILKTKFLQVFRSFAQSNRLNAATQISDAVISDLAARSQI